MQSESERVLQAELVPGEKLLWSGQPRSGLQFRWADRIIIPYSLLWVGFAIFVVRSHQSANGPFFSRLLVIPFTIIGLYLTVGRFFIDARKRARTYYGLTNERILIVTNLSARQVQSLALRGLPEMSLTERSDRSGTIVFEANSSKQRSDRDKPLPPRFEMIEEARQIYTQIQATQRALQPVGA